MSDSESVGRAARPTPWELIFGAGVFDEMRFAAVRDELDGRVPRTASDLLNTPAAGTLLREMTPPGGGAAAVAQVSALLFAAYRFWLGGRHVYRLDDALFGDLLASGASGREIAPPHPAGYVQLPHHALWARVSEEVSPEPVDGFFWTAPPADETTGSLDLLFALGVRAGRPGLSLFDVSVEPATQLEQWADVSARADGADFANILPGGELKCYHAIVTAAEALKLAALCFDRTGDPVRRWAATAAGSQTVHEADG